jgi:hypothetical protein
MKPLLIDFSPSILTVIRIFNNPNCTDLSTQTANITLNTYLSGYNGFCNLPSPVSVEPTATPQSSTPVSAPVAAPVKPNTPVKIISQATSLGVNSIVGVAFAVVFAIWVSFQ